MTEKKIDQILKEIGSLKEGQQKNYNLIQKNGVELEKIKGEIKGVAEGHSVIRREMREMKNELKSDIKDVGQKLDEHLKVPHSVG